MNSYLFFEETKSYILKGLVIDSKLMDFQFFNKSYESKVGNIYRGRIVSKVKNINSFFIDYGDELNGFLKVKEPLFSQYNEGDSIIVQVKSDPKGDKGAQLEYYYELKGEYLILMPFKKIITISKKIPPEKIPLLKNTVKNFLGDKLGAMIRTSSAFLEDDNILLQEIDKLVKIHYDLVHEINYSPTPKILLKQDDFFIISNKYANYPVISNSKYLKQLISMKNNNISAIINKDYMCKYDEVISSQIHSLFNRSVKLDNGMELIIDKTEAFNVIDINTKEYLTNFKPNRTVDSANKESVIEILRQIHLRNLSGIILVDFINSSNDKTRNELLDYIKLESRKFINPVNVIGFTTLGILELTRQRTRFNGEFTYETFEKIWS